MKHSSITASTSISQVLQPKRLEVATIGGGTGTFPVVQALRRLPTNVTAIVAVSDTGGSSGRIRDEFGFQPVGDLRQSLAALARMPAQTWIQQLLLYRFDKGAGLEGHNLGNLILTALQDMTGSTTEALAVAQTVFHLPGRVLPATDQTVDLRIAYQDGTEVIGEAHLDKPEAPASPIKSVQLIPPATATKQVIDALGTANHVIIGPGDLFASIGAVLAVDGIAAALRQHHTPITYIGNLMTRIAQTHTFSAADHVAVVEQMLGRAVSTIVLNNQEIPAPLKKLYATHDEHEVTDDLGTDARVVRAPLVNTTPVAQSSTDTVPRSLLRHDPAALQTVLQQVLFQRTAKSK